MIDKEIYKKHAQTLRNFAEKQTNEYKLCTKEGATRFDLRYELI